MRVIFAGVGEAFDERYGNTCIIISAKSGAENRQILLDCGFTGAHDFWRYSPSPMDLDAVWISHFHGDHFMGTPLLLLRLWEEKRVKPLIIIGQRGITEKIKTSLDLSYPGIIDKLQYEINFHEVSEDTSLELLDFRWSFALSGHSSSCLALRLDYENRSIFYSGDGNPTEKTCLLAKGCDLLIHEAFGIENDHPGHGTVDLCLDLAHAAEADKLVLVHMNRDVRRETGEKIQRELSRLTDVKAILAEPGEELLLGLGQ